MNVIKEEHIKEYEKRVIGVAQFFSGLVNMICNR